ncbi:MAG: ribose 5-phosphate isomerase B [Flavobacteriaceae bacterium]|tara:strand:+ start:504 stop:935 length:432 start_codon:yes stop_codon:yes gene_type:complete
MNILVSNDHAGVQLKNEVKSFLEDKGYVVENLGDNSGESVDYPDIIHPLAKEISENKDKKGIIMCGTGNGVSMVANKYEGVRAGLCWSKEIAELIRKHNDANVLSLPARFISTKEALEIVKVFLETDFEDGGRHERRVEKIDK